MRCRAGLSLAATDGSVSIRGHQWLQQLRRVRIAGEGLHEVAVRDEERDMWSVYLAQGDYPAATRYARAQVQTACDGSLASAAHRSSVFLPSTHTLASCQASCQVGEVLVGKEPTSGFQGCLCACIAL